VVAGETTDNSFTEILTENNLEREYEKYLEHQRNQPITINKTI